MNGNKSTQNSDYATAAIPKEFCCSSMTPKQMLATRLRDISYHVSDMDRCTLCKAADELSKPENSGMGWAFPLLAFMLLGGFSGGSTDGATEAAMKAYMDAMEKQRKEAGDGQIAEEK